MSKAINSNFDLTSASARVRVIEETWNSKNSTRVANLFSEDVEWRIKDVFLKGRKDIVEYLNEKWRREQDYRLCIELWSFFENKISVRLEYEWKDKRTGQWYRTHGNEHWKIDSKRLIEFRDASVNDFPILERLRKFKD